ncbi:MAG: hypothetical protein K2Z80_08975 [Xanthobacteraceae bacterium]|nr:hypothetical protein [Xanthobacteraceae bacterium]
MLQKHPYSGRLASRLAFQLAPAVIVSAVGIALLGSLAKRPDPAPAAAPATTVIQAEATVRIVPRQAAEAEADWAPEPDASAAKAPAPRGAKPKTVAANPPAQQQQRRVAAAEPAMVAPAEPPAPEPAPATPPATGRDNFIVTGWQRVTAAAQRLSQWAQPPSGWLERSTPPRPPAPIPEQNFTNASL